MENAILLALGERLHTEISAAQLLQHVVDVLAEALHADRGTIFLLDPQRQELFSAAAHLPEIPEIRVPIDQGVAGYVARTQRIVNVPFCEEDSRFWSSVDKKTGYTTRSMLAGPLRDSQGQLLGVAQLLNKQDGIFTDDDEARFTVFSDQLASLLEDTTLGCGTNYINEQILRLSPENTETDILPFGDRINRLVASGPQMQALLRQIRKVAPTEASVLLRGESGTGKSLIARALHYNSRRREGAFIHLDCTTLPEGLMENELFGHERGAYTGAHQRKAGKVEMASQGTLFLDEIGDLPLPLQSKLLTLLQERTYTRVGGTQRLNADIRIIAATNRPLEQLVQEGRFREDLYYRLRVVQLEMPPLRKRSQDDLLQLINHFVAQAAKRHDRPVQRIRADALHMLLSYRWPGNVRELENCLESAVIFADEELTPSTLSLPRKGTTHEVSAFQPEQNFVLSTATTEPTHTPQDTPAGFAHEPSLRELEASYINYLLQRHDNNRTTCARILGIGRNTLLRKIKEYGL